SGASSKLEALRSILEEASENGQKVLVFSQYVRTLEWLLDEIGEMSTLIYHGGLGREERDDVVAKFKESATPVCLLISLGAGGVGLNLASADVVVMFDRWWNPAVEKQAAYRAHRFERSGPLHLVEFLVADTVEERIAAVLSEKQELFQEIVEEAEGAMVSP